MIRALPPLLAAALFAGAAAVRAQEGPAPPPVYRIVAPDGRIIYSDRPPSDERYRSSVVNRGGASGALVMPPPITAITAWNALSVDARRGIVPPPPPKGASSPTVVTEALADAVSQVLARAEIVETMRRVCVRAAPSASSAYGEAARVWNERNATVTAQAYRVMLAGFETPRRAKLEATAHTRLAGIQQPLASAAPAARLRWCDEAAESVTRGALDVPVASGVGSVVMAFPL